MNKTTKSIKELKEGKMLKAAPPALCGFCTFSIKEMVEKYEIPWLIFGQPNSTMIFYQCPNCHMLSGNIHAVRNTKLLQEERSKPKILSPQGNRIVKPPGGFVYPPGISKH